MACRGWEMRCATDGAGAGGGATTDGQWTEFQQVCGRGLWDLQLVLVGDTGPLFTSCQINVSVLLMRVCRFILLCFFISFFL